MKLWILQYSKWNGEGEYVVFLEKEPSPEDKSQYARPGYQLDETHEIEVLSDNGHMLPVCAEFEEAQ